MMRTPSPAMYQAREAHIRFGALQEALAAQQLLNNYVLDKRHTFVVTMFDDFEKYARVPLEYEAPEPKPFEATVRAPVSLVVACC